MVWLGLLLAPTITLLNLSLTYALVLPSCATQSRWMLHAVTVACLVVTALSTLAGVRAASVSVRDRSEDAGTGRVRRQFLTQTAVLLGALSTLAILAQWIPTWVLPPCGAG